MAIRRVAVMAGLLAGASACERLERSVHVAAARVHDAGLVALLPLPPTPDAGALASPDAARDDDAAAVAAAVDAGDPDIDQVALDDLRLIAVVAARGGPVAMVTLPSGRGVTLRRGMYVGRPARVRLRLDAGELTPVVRWRVARITPSHLRREPDGRLVEAPADVVFERSDPASPDTTEERALALTAPTHGEMTVRAAGGR